VIGASIEELLLLNCVSPAHVLLIHTSRYLLLMRGRRTAALTPS